MAAALLWPLAMAAAGATQLPVLDAPVSSVSEREQLRLGRAWLRAFRSQTGADEDALIENYLEQLTHRLAAAGADRSHPLEVFLIHSPALNAFALPGGIIGIHTGLLLHMRSEAELASVVAHELSHLQLRHFDRQRELQAREQLPLLASLLASILLISTVDPMAGLAALSATQASAVERRLRYSREHELEADNGSMQLMLAANYDPTAVLRGIERLQGLARFRQSAPEFLLTHPVHEHRLAALREASRALDQESLPPPPAPLRFELMRARVLVAHSTDPAKTLAAFATEHRRQPNDTATVYAHALALAATRQPQRAWQTIAPLLQEDSPPLAVVATAAALAADADEMDTALALLRHHRRLNPDNYVLDLSYARLALRAGDVRASLRTARRQTVLRPRKIAAWRVLAANHGAAGTLTGVYRAQAEQHMLAGHLAEARRLLGRAQQLSRNYRERAKLQQRLADLNDLEREQMALLNGQ